MIGAVDLEIRQCKEDERAAFLTALGVAFGEPVDATDERFAEILDMERTLAVFDQDRIVGTSAAFSFDMSVPGGRMPTAGVTMVGVLPTHRRRGVMRDLMRGLIDDARSRKEPAAVLWASEESIYQRFGFGLASDQGRIDIERERTRFLADPAPVGSTRLVDVHEARKVCPAIYDAAMPSRPGMLSRSAAWWRDHTLPERRPKDKDPKYYCVFSHEGQDRGYAVYRITDAGWADDGTRAATVKVQEMMALDPVAYREVWRYLFGIDLVGRIKGWFLPADLPLTLMLEEPRRLRFAKSESLWLRVVDVAGALEARTYDADDAISFAVADEFCPWNDGEWTLEVAGERGKVRRGGDALISMDVAALASVYLGAFTFAELARAGRVEECIEGGIDRADRVFRAKVKPWCVEVF